MVHACQKTGKCASPEVKKVAGDISYKDADAFASTKHKGLPEKKKPKKKKRSRSKRSPSNWDTTRHSWSGCPIRPRATNYNRWANNRSGVLGVNCFSNRSA